jgi:hypothetical protein
MAEVSIVDGALVVRMQGIRALAALKGELRVPLAHVKGAEADPEVFKKPRGLRLFGTGLPGFYLGGSFLGRGEWTFWDVHRPENAVVVTLDREFYSRLVLEVDSPAETVGLIRAAIASS